MTIDIDQLGLDLGEGIGVILRRFYPLLLRQAYADAGATLSLDLVFDLDNPFVQETLDELVTLAKGISDTTRDEIRVLLGKQADAGWSIAQLADQIRAHGEGMSASRATMIARTETAAAYSRGSILAWEDAGVVDAMEWLLGPEPCPVCQEIVSKTPRVPLGETFHGGVKHPPAHPQCTCALAPVVGA